MTTQSQRIISRLKSKYPTSKVYDLSGQGQHFVCEIEPASDHPEYDVAIEVIIKSEPHKHLKTTQTYRVLSGTLELHIDNQTLILNSNDTYTVLPDTIHWAKSDNEAWVEITSRPAWTPEDHIKV